MILVYRSCQKPDLAPVKRKYVISVYQSCQEPDLALVDQKYEIFMFDGAARSQAWLRFTKDA